MLEYKQPDISPEIDLHMQLGVQPGAEPALVDGAWRNLNPLQKGTSAHFAWKVLRDPHYAELYTDAGSVPALYEAGFFVDRLKSEDVDSLNMVEQDLTTPYHKIVHNLLTAPKDDGNPVVLVTTGGFSPIHYGHLSMMETAKNALEQQGRTVVGGYFSPSHDHYVNEKYGGEAKLSASHRIHLAHEVTDESDWLMVDPWEASYVPTDVNFTDVIRHLKSYLNHHLPSPDVDVMYVSGADNAGFARVLQYMDGGVCVSRGSQFNRLPPVFTYEGIADNPNLLFVPSDAPESEFSSSKVRQWKPLLMPKRASETYFRWRMNTMSEDGDILPPPQHFIVRDDGEWSLQQYFPGGLPEKVQESLENFRQGIAVAIETAFRDVDLPDEPLDVDVKYFSLEEQQRLVDELAASRAMLNMDACTNGGDRGINFSRLFELCDAQLRPHDLIPRPGFPSLEEQVSQIAPGDYLFLDDDIASGSTLNHLMGLLPEGINVTAIRTLFNECRRQHKENNVHEVSDIVDLKDYIMGGYGSGLVVSSPDRRQVARAPYMLPFVSGYSRATIPLSSMMSFSAECWRLNSELFNSFDKTVRLKDANPEFITLMTQIGFYANAKMSQIADYYHHRLNKNLSR